MDRPKTTWVFFDRPSIRLEHARRVLTRLGLAVTRNDCRVVVELPSGADWVFVQLERGARVRQQAAGLAKGADPVWGWELAGCESAFVVTCDDRNTTRPGDVRKAWEEVVEALQAATGGFRCTWSDTGSGLQLVPPPEVTG